MGVKDAYLIAYNLACCLGWATVWILGVLSLYDSVVVQGLTWLEAATRVYDAVAFWLQVSQSAAIMEIVHAAVGLVRSPVSVTFLQVMSRIVALVAIVYAPEAQGTDTLSRAPYSLGLSTHLAFARYFPS
jgi:very-long-chain (3R)-3-hydroxyacyl-CoA dehydratase